MNLLDGEQIEIAVEVRGLVEFDGTVYDVSRKNAEFFGVYKPDGHGRAMLVQDFDTYEEALVFGKTIAAFDGIKLFDSLGTPKQ